MTKVSKHVHVKRAGPCQCGRVTKGKQNGEYVCRLHRKQNTLILDSNGDRLAKQVVGNN